VLTLPLFVLFAFVAALGPGLLLTALMVRYRDVRIVVPFIVQFGLYVTPVAFSSEVVRHKLGEKLFMLYSVNPMVGVIDGFRWALLRGETVLYPPGFILSSVFSVVLLWAGIKYFRATEKTFADVL